MFKLALRSLIDKKLRFALTTLVVVIGVMFVVGSFALTDSLRSTFSGLAQDIASGADLTVRASQDEDFGGDFDRPTMPEEVAERVAAVDGVGTARPAVAALNVFMVDGDGDPITPPGPPAVGFSFNPGVFFTTEGRQPAAPGEFAADSDTAAGNGLRIGETYQINGPISAELFELVGVFNFGDPDSHTGLGQTMAAFELDEAQRFFGLDGVYQEIDVVVASGAEVPEVQARLEADLGAGYEVITSEVNAAEQEDDFNQVLDIFNTILLVFAFIAVFVSAFIINNTFQIIIGQRGARDRAVAGHRRHPSAGGPFGDHRVGRRGGDRHRGRDRARPGARGGAESRSGPDRLPAAARSADAAAADGPVGRGGGPRRDDGLVDCPRAGGAPDLPGGRADPRLPAGRHRPAPAPHRGRGWCSRPA